MHHLSTAAATPRRVRATIALVVGALLVAGGGVNERAAAQSSDEVAFVAAINEIRAYVGLSELSTHDELADIAREHTAAMAEAGEIFHADPISAGLSAEWIKLGENVGVGAGIQVLVDAFVASPGHYANIIDPAFTHIGVGVVWEGEALYTTHRFLQPPGSDDSPPPPTSTVVNDAEDPPPLPADTVVSARRVLALLALVEDVG
jgi:uncharacterized protein YkwD